MTVFPNMLVTMDSVSRQGGGFTFHWTWTGKNTGPAGTGCAWTRESGRARIPG